MVYLFSVRTLGKVMYPEAEALEGRALRYRPTLVTEKDGCSSSGDSISEGRFPYLSSFS